MKRFLYIFLFVTFLLPVKTFSETADHVVINEIYVDAVNESGSEYIKLYNPTGLTINIEGWKIKTDVSVKDATFPLGAAIDPKSFYLLADTGWADKKDDPEWSKADYEEIISLNNSDAGISLLDSSGSIVDAVGYGDKGGIAGGYEGTPIDKSLIIQGQALQRVPDGWDTNNNEKDFKIAGQETENDENNNIPEADSSIVGVYINEVMPDPERPKSDILDEWIELYNETDRTVDLSGSILKDTVGTVREYHIPEGVVVNPRSYITFYSSATKITLNNDGDAVELLDSTGVSISATPNYGKGESGESFALDGDEWIWTSSPTPNNANVFPVEEENLSTTKTKKTSVKAKAKNDPKKKKAVAAKAKKGSSKGVVKGARTGSGNYFESEKGGATKPLDGKVLGFGLFAASLIFGMYYFNNREKLYEYFKQKR